MTPGVMTETSLNRVYKKLGRNYAPYFYVSAPPEIHYGTAGFVLGHELMHIVLFIGIEQGFKDLKDKCKSNASITNFEENIKCFSKLYGNMTMFGKKINRSLTLEETMTNAGGLYLAYKALERLLGKEELANPTFLENLDITKAQAFYLSYAQTQCVKYDEASSGLYFEKVHPFMNIRVKETLQNSRVRQNLQLLFRIHIQP